MRTHWNDLEFAENGRKLAKKVRMSEGLKFFNEKTVVYYNNLTNFFRKSG